MRWPFATKSDLLKLHRHIRLSRDYLANLIRRKADVIMANDAEQIAQLNAIKDQLVKVGGETSLLLLKIQELQDLLANQPVSDELKAAIAAVAAQAQVVDDAVPDATQ